MTLPRGEGTRSIAARNVPPVECGTENFSSGYVRSSERASFLVSRVGCSAHKLVDLALKVF